MKNKICTSIEQSQKLIELGIDISTADMFWDTAEPDKRRKPLVGPISDYCDMEDWAIPAWSISALLKLMPNNTILHCSEHAYSLGYKDFCTATHINSMGAVFDMVCWLLENKK